MAQTRATCLPSLFRRDEIKHKSPFLPASFKVSKFFLSPFLSFLIIYLLSFTRKKGSGFLPSGALTLLHCSLEALRILIWVIELLILILGFGHGLAPRTGAALIL